MNVQMKKHALAGISHNALKDIKVYSAHNAQEWLISKLFMQGHQGVNVGSVLHLPHKLDISLFQ